MTRSFKQSLINFFLVPFVVMALPLLSELPSVGGKAFAQVAVIEESFDGVTAPTLPAGWTSQSVTGGPDAVTTTTGVSSAPNAVSIPAPGALSVTRLFLPPRTFNTGVAEYNLELIFKHKYNFEPYVDGGVLEVSLNGGADFIDVMQLPAPIVVEFKNNSGYKETALAPSSNPLSGRRAWTDNSSGFSDVILFLRNIPDNSELRFRLVAGTNDSNSSSDWVIDDVIVRIENDSAYSFLGFPTEVPTGGSFGIDFSVVSPTLEPLVYMDGDLVAPSAQIEAKNIISSGQFADFGNWQTGFSFNKPVNSTGSSSIASFVVRDVPGWAGARLTLGAGDSLNPSRKLGAQTPLVFLSSSPPRDVKIEDVEVALFSRSSNCTISSIPNIAGKVAFIRDISLACPYGATALALQNQGAVAVAFEIPPSTSAPVVSEAATPGLNIPVFTTSYSYSFSVTGEFNPLGTKVTIEGSNLPESRSIPVALAAKLISSPAPDLVFRGLLLGDNFQVVLVNAVTDSDGDSVADVHDLCRFDPLKTAPGTCGCGVPDVDKDGDGFIDCADTCPLDPAKNAPGGCGCGVPDIDLDFDLVPSCLDQCPFHWFKTNPGVCGCGLFDTDNNGNGIVDCLTGSEVYWRYKQVNSLLKRVDVPKKDRNKKKYAKNVKSMKTRVAKIKTLLSEIDALTAAPVQAIALTNPSKNIGYESSSANKKIRTALKWDSRKFKDNKKTATSRLKKVMALVVP